MVYSNGRVVAVPLGTGLVMVLALPGAVWFVVVAWMGLGLPFPEADVSVGAGHRMAPLDWAPRRSLGSDSLSSSLFILLALMGLATGLITSRRATQLRLASILASALVVAVYLLVLAWEKWWASATFRPSVLAISDNEHGQGEFLHAAVVFYAFAAGIWISSIWVGVGMTELYRVVTAGVRKKPTRLGEG